MASQINIPLAILVIFLSALIMGAINAFANVVLGVTSFIATLNHIVNQGMFCGRWITEKFSANGTVLEGENSITHTNEFR